MSKKKYKGVVVPVITPLTEQYKLDHQAVEKIISNLQKHQTMPFILGTTGEASSLSAALKYDYLRLVVRLKQSSDITYAGISSNCLEESIELAKRYFDAGLDIAIATLPSYYMLSGDNMKQYFEQLANAIPGPLIIYNMPATTHMSIPLDVIDYLSHHENIAGIKDSERSEERLKDSITRWKTRPDFSHFLGWAAKSAEALIQGSDGLVPSTGNIHPQLYNEMYLAVLKNDHEKARQLQIHSDLLGDLYQSGRMLGESLAALKVVMEELGLCEPYMMPPLCTLEEKSITELNQTFHQLLKKEQIILKTVNHV